MKHPAGATEGTVISVRGSVVDVHFTGTLPELHNQLITGDEDEIMIEVTAHLNEFVVRGIALTPTEGLAAAPG